MENDKFDEVFLNVLSYDLIRFFKHKKQIDFELLTSRIVNGFKFKTNADNLTFWDLLFEAKQVYDANLPNQLDLETLAELAPQITNVLKKYLYI